MGNPYSVFGNYGLVRIMDSMSRFLRPGTVHALAFLRVKNFTEQGPVQQLGFSFTPTASGAQSGYTDYQIDPPPSVQFVSMHNIGMAAQANIQLRLGARNILISHTFVAANMAARNFTDPRQVFNDPSTVGIIINNFKTLVSIETYMPDIAYGSPATWSVMGNAVEDSDITGT